MSENQFLKTVGQRIRDRRIHLEMSQEDLAKLMGKTQDAISGYESGLRSMRLSELPLLAKALEVPITFLVGDKKDRMPYGYNRSSPYVQQKLYGIMTEVFWIDESVRKFLRDHEIVDEEFARQMIDGLIFNKQEILLTEEQKSLIELWKRHNKR